MEFLMASCLKLVVSGFEWLCEEKDRYDGLIWYGGMEQYSWEDKYSMEGNDKGNTGVRCLQRDGKHSESISWIPWL